MRKILPFLFALFLFLPPLGAEPVLKVLGGRVKKVEIEKQQVTLSYRHPVSARVEELTLKVDRQTGFSRGIRLENLRPEDPVSVEYEEEAGGSARAVQINRVPLRGVPIDKKPSL